MRFLLPALLFSAGAATAQPVLTSATNLPTVGLANTVFRLSTATPGTGGANVTWDFSTLSPNSTTTGNYTACPGTTGCSLFASANANLTGNEASTGNTLFYNASSSALSVVGIFGTNGDTTIYSNPEDLLRFPMTYGTTYTDTSRASYTVNSLVATRTGSTTVTADGWGTLKLPMGAQYNNVLRVKRTSSYVDTTPLGVINATLTAYLWYTPAHKEFLLFIAQVASPFGNGTTVSYTLPGIVAGINDAGNAGAFSAAPNPAQDRVAVRWATGTQATLILQDLTGRTVAQAMGRGEATMDVTGLPHGMYMLRAIDAHGATSTQKISLR